MDLLRSLFSSWIVAIDDDHEEDDRIMGITNNNNNNNTTTTSSKKLELDHVPSATTITLELDPSDGHIIIVSAFRHSSHCQVIVKSRHL